MSLQRHRKEDLFGKQMSAVIFLSSDYIDVKF